LNEGEAPPDEEQPEEEPAPEGGDEGGLIGPVQIEFVPGLDMIIVKGNKRDVDRVMKIIQDIENNMQATEPLIEIYQLKHVNSIPMAELVTQVYDQVLSPRQGPVSITPL